MGGSRDAPDRTVVAWAACFGVALLAVVVTGMLGPSAAVPPLRADPGPSSVSPVLVTVLLATAVVSGGLTVLLGLRMLARGVAPAAPYLLGLGLVASAVVLGVAPVGNADVGSYAAYGRMVVLGDSPYTTTPDDLAPDVVAGAAEFPWRDQVSVYGPVATAEHAAVAWLGGADREVVLRGLSVAAWLAFVAVGLVLHRRGQDPGRAAVLWTANPLLHLHLVAGAHVDGLLALGVLLAVLAARPLISGAWLGVAVAVKATAGLPALGLALHSVRTAPARAGAALAVSVPLYLAAGGDEVVAPLSEAGRRVSAATPWRWVASGLEQVLPDTLARQLVSVGSLLLALLLARELHRWLPPADAPSAPASPAPPQARPWPAGARPPRAPAAGAPLALVVSVAWLLAAGYQLPWYDALGWVLLPLLLASRLDGVLLLHTTVLSLAYLPGRAVPLPAVLDAVLDVVRGGLVPLVILATWAVLLSRRRVGTGSTASAAAAQPEDR